jgi:hypothetical protein
MSVTQLHLATTITTDNCLDGMLSIGRVASRTSDHRDFRRFYGARVVAAGGGLSASRLAGAGRARPVPVLTRAGQTP